MPFPEDGYRLDPTEHPFAISIGRGDVRLTTRYDRDNLAMSLFSAMHEAGHGLYESGVDPALARTPLAKPRSLGLHESQSRLWENWVGRGRPYLTHILPKLRDRFPDAFGSVDVDELFRDANRIERSLIRIEADEVTYNLHILIRFELELEIFDGTLALEDLPEAWNARYRDYLGLEVPDDARGVLQDVHWPGGAFGYFPTYSLGNVIAAPALGGRRARHRRARRAHRLRRPGSARRVAAREGPPPRPQALAGRGAGGRGLRGALGRAAARTPEAPGSVPGLRARLRREAPLRRRHRLRAGACRSWGRPELRREVDLAPAALAAVWRSDG